MTLTPEEKKKIYDEEKARLEVRKQLEEESKVKPVAQSPVTKGGLLGCLGILVIVVLPWFLYSPIRDTLQMLFVSQETLNEIAKIDETNNYIDREKAALWNEGSKMASGSIRYVPYPWAHFNIRIAAFLLSIVVPIIIVIGFYTFVINLRRKN